MEIGYFQNKLNICVDEYDQKEFCGRIYHQALESQTNFVGVNQLLLIVEWILNTANYPSSATVLRGFAKTKKFSQSPDISRELFLNKNLKGEIANFVLHVQYRQNVTWQGYLTWCEKNVSKTFKSELELIRLFVGALDQSTAND